MIRRYLNGIVKQQRASAAGEISNSWLACLNVGALAARRDGKNSAALFRALARNMVSSLPTT